MAFARFLSSLVFCLIAFGSAATAMAPEDYDYEQELHGGSDSSDKIGRAHV